MRGQTELTGHTSAIGFLRISALYNSVDFFQRGLTTKNGEVYTNW
jgi:hypothetical protein